MRILTKYRVEVVPLLGHILSVQASVVDLFCGAGGLSHGFKLEGVPIAAGFDIDDACDYPFTANNDAPFVARDLSRVTAREISRRFKPGSRRVLVGCAPCQPFSTYNQKNNDPNWKLLGKFGRLVEAILPDVVSMENVPRLQNFEIFGEFLASLGGAGYEISWDVLYGPDFGLPQTRSRLVLLASRHGRIDMPSPTHAGNHVSVRDAIGGLTALSAGEVDQNDSLHRASRLSETNLKRIRQAKAGGTWRDWEDQDLVVDCHREVTGRGYAAVYGRMTWGDPSPTITTQFFGFGNGRFGHPEQDRAISLREGAVLQSFPSDYKFVRPGMPVNFKKVGRLIGNAVPVAIGRAIARVVKHHLMEVDKRDGERSA